MTSEIEQLARIKQRLQRAFGPRVITNEMSALEAVNYICEHPEVHPFTFRTNSSPKTGATL